MALDAYYQYEIRRDRDVWDYMTIGEWGDIIVVGSYWTTIPNPTDMWTEEADLGGDEEFELKVINSDELTPDTWYVVYVEFWRDPEDRGLLSLYGVSPNMLDGYLGISQHPHGVLIGVQ